MCYEYEIANLLNKIRTKEEEIDRLNGFIRQMHGIASHGRSIGLDHLEIQKAEWCDITTNRSRSVAPHFNDVKNEIASEVDRMCQKAEEKKQEIQRQIYQCEQSIQNYRLKSLEEGK